MVEVLPGNIVHLTAKTGVVVNLESAIQIVRSIDSLVDKSIPFQAGIFELSGVVYVEEDAREYFTSGKGTTGLTIGVALMADSFLGRTVGNMFVNLHPNCKFPIKFFDSPIRAEHWIRGLVRDYNESNDKQVA